MTQILEPEAEQGKPTREATPAEGQRPATRTGKAGTSSPTEPDDPAGGGHEVGHPAPGPELIMFVEDKDAMTSLRQASQAPGRGGKGRGADRHNEPPSPRPASPLLRILHEESADVEPLFEDDGKKSSVPQAEPPSITSDGSSEADEGVDPLAAFRVVAPPERLEHLLKRLSEEETVDGVFIKPPVEPAAGPHLNAMAAAPAAPPAQTPDFTPMQAYLDPAAAGGIDARFAWAQKGGRGDGIRIIDLEGEWRYTHESLGNLNSKLLGGSLANSLGWRNHGTAVVGVLCGIGNGSGISGICGRAKVQTISSFGPAPWSSARAIRAAAGKLRPGDILLLELHRPGPRYQFTSRPLDQKGYVAVEWWPDDYAAIRYATRRGVIVVAAAGNGGEDLDDAIYNNGPVKGRFPKWWQNPFARLQRDSGAILVGAGAPPSGKHGPDRSRLGFSNFGNCVDCQGWGRGVVSAGYGDMQGGADEDRWYTSDFSGTSSASPIVVGAVGCLQGALRGAKKVLLPPHAVRTLLRANGSPQQPEASRPVTQRIGPRPNLRVLIPAAMQIQAAAPAQRRAGKAGLAGKNAKGRGRDR